MNKVIVMGNLGQDVELKSTPNGTSVANFSIATNERWKDKEGKQQERTEWHNVVVWGKQAESCSKYLSKGSKVLVEGSLKTNSWEDKDTKKKMYRTEVNASNVQFVDTKGTGGGGKSGGGAEFNDEEIPF